MTISAWIGCIIASIIIITVIICIIHNVYETSAKIFATTIGIILIIALFAGSFWYFNNTASGRRALINQKSELNNGLERVINIYTANGDIIATYTGKIDIEKNDGGYVKFDFGGKRYTYYNCFVETIGDIN